LLKSYNSFLLAYLSYKLVSLMSFKWSLRKRIRQPPSLATVSMSSSLMVFLPLERATSLALLVRRPRNVS